MGNTLGLNEEMCIRRAVVPEISLRGPEIVSCSIFSSYYTFKSYHTFQHAS